MRSSLGHGLMEFVTWWQQELRGMLPIRSRPEAAALGPRLVLAPSDADIAIFSEEEGARHRIAGFELGDPAAFETLRDEAHRLAPMPIGLRFLTESCLTRTVAVPRRAAAQLDDILTLDFEASTHIRSSQVYLAHRRCSPQQTADGKLHVMQYAIKRSRIEPYQSELASRGLTLDFVDCWSSPDDPPIAINFLGAAKAPSKPSSGAILTASIACGLGLILCAAIWLTRQEAALDQLRAEAELKQSRVVTARAEIDQITALADRIRIFERHAITAITPLQVIEELSRLLPDDTWLTDVLVDEDKIDISGYARSAPAVVTLLGSAPLFAAPQLTAPVMFDSREGKERFSLRAQLRQTTQRGEVDTVPVPSAEPEVMP